MSLEETKPVREMSGEDLGLAAEEVPTPEVMHAESPISETPESHEAALAAARENLAHHAEVAQRPKNDFDKVIADYLDEQQATIRNSEARQLSEERSVNSHSREQLRAVGYGLSGLAVIGGFGAAVTEGTTAISALGLDGLVSSLVSSGMTDSAAGMLALMSVPAVVVASVTTLGWAGMKAYHSYKENKILRKR
ncbi:MAG: hypothetical protein ACREGR_03165 [Minisyncoccia bacterium]